MSGHPAMCDRCNSPPIVIGSCEAHGVSRKIEVVEPGDEQALVAAAALVTAFRRESVDDDQELVGAELGERLRHSSSHREGRIAVVRDGNDVVGFSFCEIDNSGNDAHVVWVRHLVVDPSVRGSGVGRGIFDDLVAHARSLGRSTLIGSYVAGDPVAERFARSVNAQPDILEEDNRLRVRDLDETLLERWVAGAPAGYSLLTWEGRAADELVAPMCRVLEAMNDAPMQAGLEPTRFTPEIYYANQVAMEASGGVGWHAAVMDDQSGELVAYTEIGQGRHHPSVAAQGLTCVDPGHRGRGIGKWVKAANLLMTLADHAQVKTITTDNAGANDPMLAINRALGFHTVRTWQSLTVAVA